MHEMPTILSTPPVGTSASSKCSKEDCLLPIQYVRFQPFHWYFVETGNIKSKEMRIDDLKIQ